ncbi:4-oxalocrotonate tautomerase family protein [Streptomyces sp. NPDC001714]|uniref:tautomerase family protein n=1 Tax=Streptomyces sp. NPDC001714 TaxID=3364603 RepID=UPI0036AF5091
MPHFTVHISDTALDEPAEQGLIRGLAEAVGSVYGEPFGRLVAVDLVGIPQRRRGIGGKPTADTAPNVTLSLREAAYRHPEVPDAPARLIAAITDAVVRALGEHVRGQVTVALLAVPEGRSGVGGRVA